MSGHVTPGGADGPQRHDPALRLPTFRSYERHVDELMRRFAAVADPESDGPEVVVISGHTGTGKTRIVQEFYRRLVAELEPDEPRYHVAEIDLPEDARDRPTREVFEALRAAVRPPSGLPADPSQRPSFLWLASHLAPRQEVRESTMLVELERQAAIYLLAEPERRTASKRGLEVFRQMALAALRGDQLAGVLGEAGGMSVAAQDAVAAVDLADSAVAVDPLALRRTSDEFSAMVSRLDRAIGYSGPAEEHLPSMRRPLTPVVVVIDDAQGLDGRDAAALLRLVDTRGGARRPLLLVLTAWRHALNDPGTAVHRLIADLKRQSIETGDDWEDDMVVPVPVHEIQLERVGTTFSVPELAGGPRLEMGDLIGMLEESFPREVQDRAQLLERLGDRLEELPSCSPRIVLRMCADAVEQVLAGRRELATWADEVALTAEPGLERRLDDLQTDDRYLVVALADLGGPTLQTWLDADLRAKVAPLVAGEVLRERSGMIDVAPEMREVLRDRLGPPPWATEDRFGLRRNLAVGFSDLCRRFLLGEDIAPAEGLLSLETMSDELVLAAAPEDSVFGRLGRLLADLRDPDDPEGMPLRAARLPADGQDRLVALAAEDPPLVAIVAQRLVASLVAAGRRLGGHELAARLAREVLAGLEEPMLGSATALAFARALVTSVGPGELVEDLGDLEDTGGKGRKDLRENLVRIALRWADQDPMLSEVLLRLDAAGMLGEQQRRTAGSLVAESVRRSPSNARALEAVAPDLRPMVEGAIREHLGAVEDMPLAAELLAMGDDLSPTLATAASGAVLRALAALPAGPVGEWEDGAADPEDPSDPDPSDRVEIRRLVEAARHLWRRRDDTELVRSEDLVEPMLRLARYDLSLAFLLLDEAPAAQRDALWKLLEDHAPRLTPNQLVRLLNRAASVDEQQTALEHLRRRSRDEHEVAVKWLQWCVRHHAREDVAGLHVEAFTAVLRHADEGHTELLAMLVRSAPDAARRQSALERIRTSFIGPGGEEPSEGDLTGLIALVHARIIPGDVEQVREVLRRDLEVDPRVAPALLRLAQDPEDARRALEAIRTLLGANVTAGASGLLADPEPWITRLALRGDLLAPTVRQFRYRARVGQARAADQLLRLRLDGSHDPRRAILAAWADDPSATYFAERALAVFAPGEPEHATALGVLRAALGEFPGVAAVLAAAGAEDREVVDRLREEAALDPRSAIELLRFDPDVALPIVAGRRHWHPPSLAAWARLEPRAARAAAADPFEAAVVALVAPADDDGAAPLRLPTDRDERAAIIDLLLELDAPGRVAGVDADAAAVLIADITGSLRPGQVHASLLALLLELAARLPEDEAAAALHRRAGVVLGSIAGVLPWHAGVARAIVTGRLNERVATFEEIVVEAIPAATVPVLIELAPIVAELERPDLSELVADRLFESLRAAFRSDESASENTALPRLLAAWAAVTTRRDDLPAAWTAVLLARSSDPVVAAAALRVGLDASQAAARAELRDRVAEHAEAMDEECITILLRGDLAPLRPGLLEPVVLGALADRGPGPRMLVAWVRVGSTFRDRLVSNGHQDIVDALDAALERAVTTDVRVAAAVVESPLEAFEPLRGPAWDRLTVVSQRSVAVASWSIRTRRQGGDKETFARLTQRAARSEHAMIVVGRVFILRRREQQIRALSRDLRLIARRGSKASAAAAIVWLLAGWLTDVREAADACRRLHIADREAFERTLRALVPGTPEPWWCDRVASIHEPGSPLDDALRERVRLLPNAEVVDTVRRARATGPRFDPDGLLDTVEGLLAAFRSQDTEDDERRRSVTSLDALLEDLVRRARSQRAAAELLADVADLVGHPERVTRLLLRWASAGDDVLLVRSARGIPGRSAVPWGVLELLRDRAMHSVQVAEALALVAWGQEDRALAQQALRSHRDAVRTDGVPRWRVDAHLALVSDEAVTLDGIPPSPIDDPAERAVLGELLGRLDARRRRVLAPSIVAGHELAAIVRAAPHLEEEVRSRAYQWVRDLPRASRDATLLILGLARTDRELVRARSLVEQRHPTRAVVDLVVDAVDGADRIATLVPYGDAMFERIHEQLRFRAFSSRRGPNRGGTAALANVLLAIPERRRTAIDGALSIALRYAHDDVDVAVGLVDAIDRLRDAAITPPNSEISRSIRSALVSAIDAGEPAAIVRGLHPSMVVDERVVRRARAAVVDGSPLARVLEAMATDEKIAEPLGVETLLDREVVNHLGRALHWTRARESKSMDRARKQAAQVLALAWPTLDHDARRRVVRALPKTSYALKLGDDVIEAFEASPKAVTGRLNQQYGNGLRQNSERFDHVAQVVRTHASEDLGCAIALMHLGRGFRREAREALEPFRLHGPGLVLSALTERTNVARVAHEMMARAGDPLVDQLVDLLTGRFEYAGNLSPNESLLFASLAVNLRPRQRSMVRRVLRASDGLSDTEVIDLYAQLAETSINRREVWAMTFAHSDPRRSEQGHRDQIGISRLVELARRCPEDVRQDVPLIIDELLSKRNHVLAADARLELRARGQVPSDGREPELVLEALEGEERVPVEAALVALRYSDDAAIRSRALEVLATGLVRFVGNRYFFSMLNDASRILRTDERDCVHARFADLVACDGDAVEGQLLVDRALVDVLLGGPERVVVGGSVLLEVAAHDLRAADYLARLTVDLAVPGLSLDSAVVADCLASHAVENPNLAAAALVVLSTSGAQSDERVGRIVGTILDTPRPEIFNALVLRPVAGAWLAHAFGIGGSFLSELVDYLEERARSSVAAAVLLADLAPIVSPLDVPSARVALRLHAEVPEAAAALRRLDASAVAVAAPGEALPGPLAVQVLVEARREGRLAEMASAFIADGPARAPATVAALEVAEGTTRADVWRTILQELPSDAALGWALAGADLSADERDAVGRILRRRTSDGDAGPILVARVLRERMTEADLRRLAESLRSNRRRFLSLVLLLGPDVGWLVELVRSERGVELRGRLAATLESILQKGLRIPQLIRLAAAADQSRLLEVTSSILPTLEGDVDMLDAIGREIVEIQGASEELLEQVERSVRLADAQRLDAVELLLMRRRRQIQTGKDQVLPEQRRWGGPVEAAVDWRRLTHALDGDANAAPKLLRQMGTDRVHQLLRPGTPERLTAFAVMWHRAERMQAGVVDMAVLLRLRRDLYLEGERLALPKALPDRVEPMIEDEAVLREALWLPWSILPAKGALDLYFLLESLSLHLALGSVRVARALLEVLAHGHPLAHLVPGELRSQAVSLATGSVDPVAVVAALRSGAADARDVVMDRLSEERTKHRSAPFAVTVAGTWPLDDLNDPVVQAAVSVAAGAVELDRRLRRTSRTDLRGAWDDRIRTALVAGIADDPSVVLQAMARGDGPEWELARVRFSALAQEAPEASVEALCEVLDSATFDPEDEALIFDAVGDHIQDTDVALALVRAAGQRITQGQVGPLVGAAMQVLLPVARSEAPVAALLVPGLGMSDRAALLHIGSTTGSVEATGLLVPDLPVDERIELGRRLVAPTDDEVTGPRLLGVETMIAALAGNGEHTARLMAALPAEARGLLKKELFERARLGSEGSALAALRWRVAEHRSDPAVLLTGPGVGRELVAAAGAPGALQRLRTDPSIQEVVVEWWDALGLASGVGEALVRTAFHTPSSGTLAGTWDFGTWELVREVGTVAIMRREGVLGLATASQLMAALAPSEPWEPGAALAGAVAPGTRVRLNVAHHGVQPLAVTLVARPIIGRINMAVVMNRPIAGLVLPAERLDLKKPLRVWIPELRSPPVEIDGWLGPEGATIDDLRPVVTLQEFPVILRERSDLVQDEERQLGVRDYERILDLRSVAID